MLSVLLFLFACTDTKRPPNVAELDIQLNLPSAERFTFGPGDGLSIWVWRHEDLSMEVTVAPDGYITYPLIGRIQVAGLTYEELVRMLQVAVDEYYVDAKVAVNVTAVVNQKVLVIGEVNQPQVLQVLTELSIMEALTRAGGINPDSRTRNVLVIRGGIETPVLFTVNVDAIYGQGDMFQMVYLQRGDIVYVPTKTIANVERFFRRLQAILAPAVGASAVYRNAISGGAQGTSSVLE
jgi:polysaccharide export outer membrane protein